MRIEKRIYECLLASAYTNAVRVNKKLTQVVTQGSERCRLEGTEAGGEGARFSLRFELFESIRYLKQTVNKI